MLDTLVIDQPRWIAQIEQERVTLNLSTSGFTLTINHGLPGPPGPPGPPGTVIPTIDFSWGDASPAPIAVIEAGVRVTGVNIYIDTAFDGVGARLSVGTLADPDLLVDGDILAPIKVIYELTPDFVATAQTSIFLFITPGAGASNGAGSIIFQRQ